MSLAELASKYEIHPNLIFQWQKELLDKLPELFKDKRVKENRERERGERKGSGILTNLAFSQQISSSPTGC